MNTISKFFKSNHTNIDNKSTLKTNKQFSIIMSVVLLFINILAITLTFYSLYDSKQENIKHTVHNAENLSIILEKNIEGTLNRVNIILADISNQAIQTNGMENGFAQLSSFLAHQREYLTDIDNIGIFNNRKELVYHFNNSYYGNLLVLSNFYEITKNGVKNDLYISEPIKIGPKKSWHIILSRKIEYNGQFYGVSFTVYPVEQFNLLFRDMSIGKNGAIILRNQDKSLVTRFPDISNYTLKDKPSAIFTDTITQKIPHLKYSIISPVDSIFRFHSIKKVGRYPLYINVGLSTEDGLTAWKTEFYKIIFILISFIILTTLGAKLVYHSWRKISKNDERLQLILNSAGEAIYGIDNDGLCTFCNNACITLLGYEKEEDLLGQHMHDLIHHTHEDGMAHLYQDSRIHKAISKGISIHSEEDIFWNKNGSPFPVEYQAYPQIVDSKVVGAVITFTDITEKKQINDIIWKQANYDTLTQLPNRHLFHKKLEEELTLSSLNNQKFALFFIDLDHFKDVNDSLGHHTGDFLLEEVSNRLLKCVRKTDLVARLGGDEFTIILSNISQQANIDNIAQKIITSLESPFIINDNIINISASIGITVFPKDGETVETLLKNADQAMYYSKEDGRNRYHYFSLDMDMKLNARLEMYHDLRAAINQQQFAFHLQPVIDLNSGKITKAEALLRWNHPVKGFISPVDFIPVAEKMGLIEEIGDWVFKSSTTWLANWLNKNEFHYPMQLSINMSPLQLNNPNIVNEWREHLLSLNLCPSFIVIEITEGLLLEEDPTISEKIRDFREMGILISIDDFGTGYSAMSYLYKYDIDFIKIDRSFIINSIQEEKNKTIVQALILMAHKLGIKVVAEGIENQSQYLLLKESECDYGQGFLFSKAIPTDDFEKLDNFSTKLLCIK